eukprot:TRINITY_DN1440_c0_g1_i3.p4 TRINITY_DN1440_c0_g1~~TRINITY_DN1440_c0_g1_i3.p4  ORF type:complete len:114 (-),score=3.94 TRINITY_DN1440_c0_g1_i3:837-1178(-)
MIRNGTLVGISDFGFQFSMNVWLNKSSVRWEVLSLKIPKFCPYGELSLSAENLRKLQYELNVMLMGKSPPSEPIDLICKFLHDFCEHLLLGILCTQANKFRMLNENILVTMPR